MEKKPKILITNDDGIESKGIWHLWKALSEIGDLSVIAPATEKSGVGTSLTLYKPLTITPFPWENNSSAWKINGTPADCVRFGIRVVLKEPPDLIVSGINHGSNSGRNVLYSGTIGGVIEGALRGIPGIAFSCSDFLDPPFEQAERYVKALVEHFLTHPPTLGTLLNVNFPLQAVTKNFKGVKLARQGKGLWRENPDERIDPKGDFYYWHGGKWAHHDEHEESDVFLLEQGYVTVVPIHVDQLTDHRFLQERASQFNSSFNFD